MDLHQLTQNIISSSSGTKKDDEKKYHEAMMSNLLEKSQKVYNESLVYKDGKKGNAKVSVGSIFM
jgi:hypothetical protein